MGYAVTVDYELTTRVWQTVWVDATDPDSARAKALAGEWQVGGAEVEEERELFLRDPGRRATVGAEQQEPDPFLVELQRMHEEGRRPFDL